LCIEFRKEGRPVWSDVDSMGGNAMLSEQLLGFKAIWAVEAREGHDLVDAYFMLAKVEHVCKLPLAELASVWSFTGVSTRVAVIVVLLVEALVAHDAGKSFLDATQVYNIDMRLKRRVELKRLSTVLALVVPQAQV
jgi:hypothetical protein